MHTLPPPPRVETFLQCLALEERLIAAALERADAVFAALRGGDVPAAAAAGAEQHEVAAELRAASDARLGAARDLARDLDLSADPLTLRLLADRLPDPFGAEVSGARERLTALTSELTRIQARNANLLGHLRSFYRSVLAELTAGDTPARYGPTGGWLAAPPGPSLLTRGTP